MGLRDLLVQKWQHQDSRVRIAAVSELCGKGAQAVLNRLAVHDPDKAVRRAAAAKLKGEQVAALVKETENESARLELVSTQLNDDEDQPLLLEIALGDPSGYVRGAAVHKLRVDALLVAAALSEQAPDIGSVAVQRLQDLSLALHVAKTSRRPSIRGEAVRRLDRSLYLEEIVSFAQNDPDDWVRETALSQLHREDCPALFDALLQEGPPTRLRIIAVQRTPLPEKIEAIRALATADPEPAVRRTAVSRLETKRDLLTLIHVARTDADAGVRRAAVDGIDPLWIAEVLFALSTNDPDPTVRAAARKRCSAAPAAPHQEDDAFRPETLDRDRWQEFICRAAAFATEHEVREAAISMLDPFLHEKSLRRIAKHDKSPTVRAGAAMKLNPATCKKLLKSLAEKDKDARVRRAAAYRLSSVS